MSTLTPDSEEADDEGADDDERREASPGPWADWARGYREIAPYLDLGWRIVGAAAFPPILGYGADLVLDTLPWGVLVGAGIGLVGAVLQLRQVSAELGRTKERP